MQSNEHLLALNMDAANDIADLEAELPQVDEPDPAVVSPEFLLNLRSKFKLCANRRGLYRHHPSTSTY